MMIQYNKKILVNNRFFSGISIFMLIAITLFFIVNANDYSGHWAQDDINYLIDKGIVSGTGNGVNPDGTLLRCEFIKLINKTMGYSDKDSINYPDVSKADWFFDDMLIAKKQGYIKGDENGNSNPNFPISRVESAVIIARILNLDLTNTELTFADKESIPYWAAGAVNSLFKKGLLSGYEDKNFRGNNNILRAEGFSIIRRVLNNSNSEIPTPTATTTAVPVAGGGGGGGGGGKKTPKPTTETYDKNVFNLTANAGINNLDISFSEPIDTNYSKAYVYLNDDNIAALQKGTHTYSITGLIPNKEYAIKVTAINKSNIESSGVSITERTMPNEVSDLLLQFTDGTLQITFKQPIDSDYLKAIIYLNNELEGREVLKGTSLYLINNLSGGQEYNVKVIACYSNSIKSLGVSAQITPDYVIDDNLSNWLLENRIEDAGITVYDLPEE